MATITPIDLIGHEDFLVYFDNKITPLLNNNQPITLLEVGCGSGVFAKTVLDKYKDKIIYKAIDASPEAITKAKERGINAECISFENYHHHHDSLLDVVLFTKSFHHVDSIKDAIEKVYTLLKPNGLFISDEFGRELVDEKTATFLYPTYDKLEDEGVFVKPPRAGELEDRKLSYVARWHSRFNRAHRHHGEKKEGEHHHHGEKKEEHHHHGEKKEGEHHHHHHGEKKEGECNKEHHHHHHQQNNENNNNKHQHHHPLNLPSSVEMTEVIKKRFPNVEVSTNSFLFNFIAIRFEGSDKGIDIIREFKKKEEEMIAKGAIVPIGLRFCAAKL